MRYNCTTTTTHQIGANFRNPGNIKNYSDFATYLEAKTWFDKYFRYYGDAAKLDGDGDGDGEPCESLPEGH